MKQFGWLFILALVLAACASAPISLTPDMLASMTSYADQYDVQYPGNDLNIARLCATDPSAVYWNDTYSTWAVTCVTSLPNVYGAVTFDKSYQIMSVENISATSQNALDDLIRPVGWVRQ